MVTLKVGDTLTATIEPADATNITNAKYVWSYGDAVDKIDTVIEDATTSTLVVTDKLEGKFIKVVVTDDDGNTFEAKTTAAAEKVVVKPVVSAVKQTKANAIEVTFDIDAKASVNKDNLKVERVDGLAVIPVNALEWSEDGKTASATLSSALVDKIDYQVSYDGGAATTFTASVGKVASIAILTASAEQNVTTDVKFTLLDANGVDVTSAINVDTTCEVAIEGVDNASVTANTSKPSAATVQMNTVGDKAKVTVTYRADESIAPVSGVIECTAPKATVGNPRFRMAAASGTKEWADGTECAIFYAGADATVVGISVGGTRSDVYFCAEDKAKAGTIISYDTYEVSSSNDDVMSASIENSVDTGKYCQINVSGNTVGTANILVKATKNGAAYTYTIPVQVVATRTLTGLSVTASRTQMSNAIDTDYFGTLTVVGKYSDGTTGGVDFTSEVADQEKNNKLSTNLLAIYGETQDNHANTTARGAGAFTVVDDEYWAYGSQGKTYTISVSATSDTGKEIKASVSVKVDDLSQAAWNIAPAGVGAKMEYSMEFTNGAVLTEGGSVTATTAKLAAYADKKFAGYVRQDEDGNVAIGTGDGYVEAEDAIAAEYVLNDGAAGDVLFTAKGTALGEAGNGYTFTKNVIVPADAVPSKVDIVVDDFANNTKFTFTASAEDEEALEGKKIMLVKAGDGSDTTITAAYAANTVTFTMGHDYAGSAADAVTAMNALLAAGVEGAPDAFANVTVSKADDNETADAGEAVSFTDFTAAVVEDVTIAVKAVTISVAADTSAADIETLFNNDNDVKNIFTASRLTSAVTATAHVVRPGVDAVEFETGAGQAKATPATTIEDVFAGVKYGNKYSATGDLFDSAANIALSKNDLTFAANAATSITLDAVNETGTYMVVGKTNLDETLAKPGTYTATFFYTLGVGVGITSAAKQAESTVTVKNAYVAPTVTVTKRVLDSLSADYVKEALKISCDMNNNESEAASFDDTVWKNAANNTITESDAESTKWTATYVGVSDQGIQFIIPINATFTAE